MPACRPVVKVRSADTSTSEASNHPPVGMVLVRPIDPGSNDDDGYQRTEPGVERGLLETSKTNQHEYEDENAQDDHDLQRQDREAEQNRGCSDPSLPETEKESRKTVGDTEHEGRQQDLSQNERARDCAGIVERVQKGDQEGGWRSDHDRHDEK